LDRALASEAKGCGFDSRPLHQNKMKQLTAEQLTSYLKDPVNVGDANVRRWCSLPDNRYYTVSVWPDESAGQVRVSEKMFRDVKVKKISKSD
jgi:hypothetical protein